MVYNVLTLTGKKLSVVNRETVPITASGLQTL